MTLKQVIIDAVATQPKPVFKSIDVIKDVRQIMPEANAGSIRTCLRRDLVKDGIVVKASRFLWRRAEEQKPDISAVDLGSAIIDYVENLKKTTNQLNIKISDLEIRLRNSDKEWREVLKQKDNTIESLNRRISALNSGKTFSFNSPRLKT
jgi:hypothetical protein